MERADAADEKGNGKGREGKLRRVDAMKTTARDNGCDRLIGRSTTETNGCAETQIAKRRTYKQTGESVGCGRGTRWDVEQTRRRPSSPSKHKDQRAPLSKHACTWPVQEGPCWQGLTTEQAKSEKVKKATSQAWENRTKPGCQACLPCCCLFLCMPPLLFSLCFCRSTWTA